LIKSGDDLEDLEYDLISVVLAVYNGERYVSDAIKSILDQDYPNYEIIVVNDGSDDQTLATLQAYGNKINLISLEVNKGQGFARNYAIKHAKGKFLAFLDHDDMWVSDKLSKQHHFFITQPSCDYVICRMTSQLLEGQEWPSNLNLNHYSKDSVALILGTTLIKKKSFLKVGWFDSQFGSADDTDWFARASDAGLKKGVVDEVLLVKRIHSSNISLNSAEANKNLFKALRSSVRRKEE
jgi:glycosyltransferase involved in cell wall biosynthesis